MKALSPQEAKKMLDEGKAKLIDIREPQEYAREHIAGSRIIPLSVMESQDMEPREIQYIFHCRTGTRTKDAASLLDGKVAGEALILDGGLKGWAEAGLPTVKKELPVEIMRQVQIGAGSLVLLGLAGGLWWPPAACLSAFVGAGLIFAGISGFCGLARVLRLMPWNKDLKF